MSASIEDRRLIDENQTEEPGCGLLPTELYAYILEDLDYQSLFKCMQVCSMFRDLIQRTASLQYVIELAVAEQRGGLFSNKSSAERLQLLKSRQYAWQSLNWSREIKIPMESGGLWELFGGVLGQSREDGCILFHQLPSDTRSIEYKTWSVGPDFGIIVRDFAMDPSQDLLVLVESPDWSLPDSNLRYRIHLRSLTTGKPHSHAARSLLALSQAFRDLSISYTIQIFGGLIAVLFKPSSAGENEIAIWQWKSGDLLLDVHNDDILSFTFLSDAWIILSSIDIYGCPCLQVINFLAETSERHDLQQAKAMFTFEYPELHPDVFISEIGVHSHPGTQSQVHPNTPFSEDIKDFLLVVNLWLFVDGALRCLIHFIPASHLLSCIDSPSHSIQRLFAWDKWVDKTRMLFTEKNPSDVWVCDVAGMKFVISEHAPDAKTFSGRLYDFHQLALRRDSRKTDESVSGIELNCKVIKEEEAFDCVVSTSLPYRTATFNLEDGHDHCAALCSEDNIVVVDNVGNTEFWYSSKVGHKGVPLAIDL